MGYERAEWMRGNWGLMSHWLYQPVDTAVAEGDLSDQVKEWNNRVNNFDTQKLASQLAETGAKWFILTIGQNSGFYCAPNTTYDKLVDYPLSKCSERDLFTDLASELAKKDIKTIAYLPSGAPDRDEKACRMLEWTDGTKRDEKGEIIRTAFGYRAYDLDHRLANFQRKWESVVENWAENWGELCSGWWIDGVYFSDAMYRKNEEPNFNSFASALRAGNPNAAICLNPGILRADLPEQQSDIEDYCAGELNSYLYVPFGRKKTTPDVAKGYVGNSQLQLLNFLGGNWGQGPAPRLPDDLTIAWTRYILSGNGGVTWDVPTSLTGEIPENFMSSLIKLGAEISF